MAGTASILTPRELRLTQPRPGSGQRAVAALARFARRKPVGAVAGLIILLVLLTGVFAGLIARFSPIDTSPIDSILPPDSNHWFGTDVQGRDVFARIVYGVRISVGVGLGAVLIGVGGQATGPRSATGAD